MAQRKRRGWSAAAALALAATWVWPASGAHRPESSSPPCASCQAAGKAPAQPCELCQADPAPASAPAPASKPRSAPAAGAYRIGSKVRDFSLLNASTGQQDSLVKLAGKNGTVLVFYDQSCPFVQEAQDRIAQFHNEWKDRGFTVVAIDAGVNNSPEAIQEHAQSKPFPILINPDSKIASLFGATHTPEVFLLDKDRIVRYHGAFDSGKMKNATGRRKTYVKDAAEALLRGEKPTPAETQAFGSTIQYAEGVKPLS